MKSLDRLIKAFRRLPGVGPRQAERFALHYLRAPESEVAEFTQALLKMRGSVHLCPQCFAYSEGDICEICSDDTRDQNLICVVEEDKDIEAIEKTKTFNGVYHVLHGSISPMDGRTADSIKIKELVMRVQDSPEEIREVIIATNPDTEGETTSLYIADVLRGLVGKISRIGYGMPLGGHIDYIDELTLSHAFKGRTKL
ncbi:MAG: recombination mediator RecR [Elusimicrobiota bacterium]|jgi:recombination protein RecR|nr:recombination mediator RecR [Elusimicrobiota bacterium]